MKNIANAALFDKLADLDMEVPFEKNPKNSYSLIELQNSIIEDLTRLLNTRINMIFCNCAQHLANPFLYGIDLSSAFCTDNIFDMQEIESRINKVIKQFEPRLIDPQSHVSSISNGSGIIFLTIDAIVILEHRHIQLSFPIVLDAQ